MPALYLSGEFGDYAMKKSIIKYVLKILIIFLIIIAFLLLVPTKTESEISEIVDVGEQKPEIGITKTLNYNINLDDSANVIMCNELDAVGENDFRLYIVYFSIMEVSENIN